MVKIEKKQIDRRRFIRVRATLVTNFRVFCVLEEIDNPQLQNISQGGLMFTSNQSLTIGQALEIKLTVPALEETIEFGGRVIWNDRTERKISYNTGVAIADIEPEDQEKLKQLVEKVLAAEKEEEEEEEEEKVE